MKRAIMLACTALCTISITAQPIVAQAGQDNGPFQRLAQANNLRHAGWTHAYDADDHPDDGRYRHHHHRLHLSHQQLVQLVRHKIKYVFVIYQENRSFDSYPGLCMRVGGHSVSR